MTTFAEQEAYARIVGPELDASLSSLAQFLHMSDGDVSRTRDFSTVLLGTIRQWLDERVTAGDAPDCLADVIAASLQVAGTGMRIALRDADKELVARRN